MPSCDATDVFTKSMRGATPLTTTREDCWREKHCEEAAQGRPECPPGRCRYGGKEHDRIPCPDHDRPFGRGVSGGRSTKGKGKKVTKRSPKKTAGRRKVTARSAPRRKVAKKKTKR